MRKIKSCLITIIFAALLISAHTLAQGIQKDSSAGGSSILNPLPGETVVDTMPMIGVKLPMPTPPLDPDTIKLFIDGSDVTAETQIGLEYIFYTPQMALTAGNHNVLITFQQVCQKYTDSTSCTNEPGCSWSAPKCSSPAPISPISWSFAIGSKAAVGVAPSGKKPPVGSKQATPSTTGRYLVKIRSINLDNGTRAISCANCTDSDIKYKEAVNTTGTFDFTDRFYGKTLTGHYDRSVEEITGRANDRFNFRYVDAKNNDISMGDFYLTSRDFSALTINGIQLRGIQLKHELSKTNNLSVFSGRSQEPQDGRIRRSSYGLKLDSKVSNTNAFRLITIRTKEYAVPGITTVPASDYIYSFGHRYTFNSDLSIASDVVANKHSENGSLIRTNEFDSAVKAVISYKPNINYSFELGGRSIGPYFNPTVLGSFTEKDREGAYLDFKFKNKTNKFVFSTFYDSYQNNLHHNATNNITDETTNSVSSVRLNYGWVLPQVTMNYSKLYGRSDKFDLGIPGIQRNESTSASANIVKEFHNTDLFTGTRLSSNLSRYDIDRYSYSTAASDYMLRSDTTNWNFSTRFTDLATLSANDSLNKSKSISTTLSSSRTKTDSLALQLNIIPFKFITNLNARHTARKTYTTDSFGTTLTADQIEQQQTITFMYYLSQKKKLSLELVNYDKQYREASNGGRSYDEQNVELGYQVEF